jgi:hypothetical protein
LPCAVTDFMSSPLIHLIPALTVSILSADFYEGSEAKHLRSTLRNGG